uniref:Uncharacterized protein n=1 Tax=Oryza brachyantha TaxID=4533 RepID=J3NCF3_ORYBR
MFDLEAKVTPACVRACRFLVIMSARSGARAGGWRPREDAAATYYRCTVLVHVRGVRRRLFPRAPRGRRRDRLVRRARGGSELRAAAAGRRGRWTTRPQPQGHGSPAFGSARTTTLELKIMEIMEILKI